MVDEPVLNQYLDMEDGLLKAIDEEKTDLAMRLINSTGINIETMDSNNDRAFHKAVQKSNRVVMDELLRQHVEVETVGCNQSTALHHAVRTFNGKTDKDLDMIKVILKCGVDRYKLN